MIIALCSFLFGLGFLLGFASGFHSGIVSTMKTLQQRFDIKEKDTWL